MSHITESERDIAQVIADEENLRVLINNTDDPMWLVDTAYGIVECNASFRKWVATFIDVELDKGDHVLYNYENKIYADKFDACYQLAMKGHLFSSVEDFLANGEVRYAAITFNPVFDNNKVVTGVSCSARDITERRRHLLKIEEQNAALREIAAIESHRVRGPVATILGLEQLFNYNDLTDPLNKEIMQHICIVTNELDRVTRDIVRMSNEINKPV
ncbi:MAG: PAS domain-containing protein [Bacteroidota bacterium]